MCLPWGLSRVVRVKGVQEVRRLPTWAWHARCKRLPTHRILHILNVPTRRAPAHPRAPFALCNKAVAHSGRTPTSLASVFGPLLFGLSAPYCQPLPVRALTTGSARPERRQGANDNYAQMSPGRKKHSEKELEVEVVFSRRCMILRFLLPFSSVSYTFSSSSYRHLPAFDTPRR
ncbi:DUF1708 domain-containing protein [Mycena sanguinolenta]|uniref:DUF1708 domain-containing protein n=1 Tax=Mycena sanguinolenta TaxID=230812 RepID=A0A8H6YGQ9_9AGAR|nr:DUF1708 domain-containing protein [Mycena sanguinolenta]